MKDFKVPVAMVTFLAAQAGGMVWFLSGIQNRVQALEGERLNNVEVVITVIILAIFCLVSESHCLRVKHPIIVAPTIPN